MSVIKYSLFILLGFVTTCSAVTVYDEDGHKLELSKPARRIISLAPDITEILYHIGLGDKIVGVIAGSDYPEAATTKIIVGSYTGLDIERIISLQPDLIVTWGTIFNKPLSGLKAFPIAIYHRLPRHLEDVAYSMEQLGKLTGREIYAQQQANLYRYKLAQLRKKPRLIKVFFQLGAEGFLTVNKESWINQAIELCGGQNSFRDGKATVSQITREDLLLADPDVIMSDGEPKKFSRHWQTLPQLTAVKNKNLFSIPPDWIDRAGPRLLKGTEAICLALDKSTSEDH